MAAHNPVKVGVIGCGNIFQQYMKGCRMYRILDVVAVADLNMELAREKAKQFGIPKAMTVKKLLKDPEIELVINLTVPKAHAEVSLAALKAGKHVYTEKPMALTRKEGQKILDLAAKNNLLTGGAPDTFLGGGLQTCRKLIDDGAIGTPVAATAFMAAHGPESWHPNPFFYYEVGGGPLFDMGPYYLTALISLLGPVRRVSGSARISFPERIATSAQHNGTRITVETPTHIAATLDFVQGAVGTLVTSFDVWHHQLPRIEIYGSEGSLSVPDPNTFSGPVRLRRAPDKEWETVSLTHSDTMLRGIGPADMAMALRTGRPVRAGGEQTYHVLDVMHAALDSSTKGKHILVTSHCAQPTPLPEGLPFGQLDG